MAVLLLLVPNLALLLLAAKTGTARPLLNMDYAVAAFLFCLPFKWGRILAVAAFAWALLFDVLMMLMQIFPFMDLEGALYLFPFIVNAPLTYQLLCIVLFIYLVGMPWLLHRLAGGTNCQHLLACLLPLTVISYFTGHLQYAERNLQANIFGANNFYYSKSQYLLYRANQNIPFLASGRKEPIFLPLNGQATAIEQLQQPASDKILLIINESWGMPNNQALHNAVLENILQQQEHFSFLRQGSFPFAGATVEAELRELCAYRGAQGFFFRRAPAQAFAQCLPNRLHRQGYETYAMHGASGQLYDRFSWYPQAGFQKVMMAENFIGKQTCTPFRGVCDHELFAEVSHAMTGKHKVFYYWLTLTTHADYALKDLHRPRLNCETYGLPEDTDLCRNIRLQGQFFDGLAEWSKQPEMQGVEVLVVGDHPPPVTNLGETFKYLQQDQVAWLHFKIKATE